MAAGGSVVIEKLADGAALGLLIAVLLWQFSPTTMLVSLLALGLVGALGGWPLVERRLGGRARLEERLAAIAYLRDKRLLVTVLGLTVAGLALGTLVNLTVLYALGITPDLRAGLLMLVAGYAAGLIPSGPAQLGVFEVTVAAPLVAAGFSYPTALSAAVTLHVVLLGMLGVGGAAAVLLGLARRSVLPRGR
jgi:uncharacterized membrane protein YbhN (UPF0104 family)